MSSLTLTDAQSAQISSTSRPTQLCNAHGQVLAVALSAEEYKRYLYATARQATSEDELEQARTEYRTKGGVSTNELYERIRQLGIPGAGRP